MTGLGGDGGDGVLFPDGTNSSDDFRPGNGLDVGLEHRQHRIKA